MAIAVCGCGCAREADGGWMIVSPEADCPHGHVAGLRGWTEGEASRVTGVGECITVIFERASRTAMLCTPSEVSIAPAHFDGLLRKA